MATNRPSPAMPRPGHSLGEFRPTAHTPSNPYHKVQQAMGPQDRIAVAITGAIGTMYAVYALTLVMAGWILAQVAMGGRAFDPYPFAFLLFLGNIVQLLLMPLLMVGQNLQSRHGEARAEEEFRRVTKIFEDAGVTMRHLDAQDAELLHQTSLLVALVETLVPEDRRSAMLADPLAPGTASGA